MFLIILIAGIKHVEMTQTYLQWPPDFLPWSLGGAGWGAWGGHFGWGRVGSPVLAPSLLLLFI